jgi:hypothetical protein
MHFNQLCLYLTIIDVSVSPTHLFVIGKYKSLAQIEHDFNFQYLFMEMIPYVQLELLVLFTFNGNPSSLKHAKQKLDIVWANHVQVSNLIYLNFN